MNIIESDKILERANEFDVTLIGTNTYLSMANGIQLRVMLDYPYAYDENLKTKYGDVSKMGTILECKKEKEPTFCLCFITKGYNFRPDLEKDYLSYESLERCLRLVNVKYKGFKVSSPILGVSRFEGNGDKDKILPIFEECLKDVDLTLFDFYDKSRAEQMLEWYSKEKETKKVDRERYYKMVAKRKKEAEERFKNNGHRRY